MVARLQQWLVLGGLLAAIGLGELLVEPLAARGRAQALVAVTCAHAAILAIEFIASFRVNGRDPVPRARAPRSASARGWPRAGSRRASSAGTSLSDRAPCPIICRPTVAGAWCWSTAFSATAASGTPGCASCAPMTRPSSRSTWSRLSARSTATCRPSTTRSLRVTAATAQPPMLVCHSMGGLAARAWLRDADPARVHRIVTIGTPHRGTWLARFGRTVNGRQMRMGGEWLRKLEGERAGTRQVALHLLVLELRQHRFSHLDGDAARRRQPPCRRPRARGDGLRSRAETRDPGAARALKRRPRKSS